MHIWVIEVQTPKGEWEPVNPSGVFFTRKHARTWHHDFWLFEKPDGNFRVKKYIPAYQRKMPNGPHKPLVAPNAELRREPRSGESP